MTRSGNGLGILLMILTTFVFSMQDGISRYLAEEYNVYLVIMIRYWFFAAFVIAIAQRSGGIRKVAQTKFPALQVFRGVLLALEIIITVLAFTLLGLTETHAIFVCYPLIIAALSGPILGERVGWRRWAAIGIGFVGVLIILQPGMGVFSPLAAIPLIGALGFAIYGLATRYVARADDSTTSFFYTGVIGALTMTLIGVFHWEWITGSDVYWMLLLCCTGVLGHWLLIKTYDVAEASAVQPFAYLQLPFAATFGMLAFGETLRLNVAIGAAIVVCAGLFTLWRERVRTA